jgi:hypothetical protein
MTVIVCDAVVLFPHASVAVQVRVMVYSWAQAPATVLSVYPNVGLLSQLSLTVGLLNIGVDPHAML